MSSSPVSWTAASRSRSLCWSITRDVTERLAAERRAGRAQRLESLGNLAAGIAHDLNNSLAPILMGVETLRLEHPEQAALLEVFESSARRAAEMVRQLLTFARGAEGRRVTVRPERLLQELERVVRAAFPREIALERDFPEHLPPVSGDPTQLHQLLLNLCVNARDAMPAGGTLTLRGRVREVDAAFASAIPDARPGTFVELSVGDTGAGIPPEVQERMFEPFFTTKGPDEGTGLGLSTCRGIAKGHDGFVNVESGPGSGTVFSAYLPVREADGRAAAEVEDGPAFRGSGERILVVDDEAPVRQIARLVLERLNFDVVTASDGADALLKATESRDALRVVLTDVNMPHMDGVALIATLRRMLPDVGVIVASGRLDERQAQALKDLGVEHRLEKPFTQARLTEALAAVLGSEQG